MNNRVRSNVFFLTHNLPPASQSHSLFFPEITDAYPADNFFF